MKVVLANQFKNESSRLVEWLEYYRDRGVKDFVLCDDHSVDDSLKKIKSVQGINCVVIQSAYTTTPFFNSKDAASYAGDCRLSVSQSINFKRIYEYVLKTYGKDVLLGFFDVDEFLVGQTKNLSEEIQKISQNHLLISINSYEIDADLFDPNSGVSLVKQTTRSTSTSNRYRSRCSYKSFVSPSKDVDGVLLNTSINCDNAGGYVHTGGTDRVLAFGMDPYTGHPSPGKHDPIAPQKDDDEWCSCRSKNTWVLVAPQKMKILHYRKPSYLKDKKLFDVDYDVP